MYSFETWQRLPYPTTSINRVKPKIDAGRVRDSGANNTCRSNNHKDVNSGYDFSGISAYTQPKDTKFNEKNDDYKTTGTAGGLTGINLDVTFSVTDTPASSLQAIQTVMCSGGPYQPGKYHWKWKGKDWSAFVDGGKNSPYAAGGSPAHPTQPYYLTAAEVAANVAFTKDHGTIRVTDVPAAVYSFEDAFFETAIVATNYDGKGKDKILKAFKWGWTGKGTKPTVAKGTMIAGVDSGISVRSSVSPEFTNIVNFDYPKYEFI